MHGSCKECGGRLPAVPSSAAVLAAAALSRGCIAALKFHNKTCSPVPPVLVANQSRLAGYCLNMLHRKLPLKRQLKLLWTALPALLVLSIIVLSGPSPLFSATFPLALAVPAPSASPSPDSPLQLASKSVVRRASQPQSYACLHSCRSAQRAQPASTKNNSPHPPLLTLPHL